MQVYDFTITSALCIYKHIWFQKEVEKVSCNFLILFGFSLALYLAENIQRAISCLSKVLVSYLQQSEKVTLDHLQNLLSHLFLSILIAFVKP